MRKPAVNIAVIGYDKTGKKSICRYLGKRDDSRDVREYEPEGDNPREFAVNEAFKEQLGNIRFIIYSKLLDFDVGKIADCGLLLLRPWDIETILDQPHHSISYDNYIWNSQLFELIQKLQLLGVYNWILCITKMDRFGGSDAAKWFSERPHEFAQSLEKHFNIKITSIVPIAMANPMVKRLCNIDAPPSEGPLKWYDGECLLKALELLLVSAIQTTSVAIAQSYSYSTRLLVEAIFDRNLSLDQIEEYEQDTCYFALPGLGPRRGDYQIVRQEKYIDPHLSESISCLGLKRRLELELDEELSLENFLTDHGNVPILLERELHEARKTRFLIAIARLIRPLDENVSHNEFIEDVMHIDRLRQEDDPSADLLGRKLFDIYHDSENFGFFNAPADLKDDSFAETEDYISRYRRELERLPKGEGNRSRSHIRRQFEQFKQRHRELKRRVKMRSPVDRIQESLDLIHVTDNLIKKKLTLSTKIPIRSLLEEINGSSKSTGIERFNLHPRETDPSDSRKRIQEYFPKQHWEYFPEKHSIEEPLSKALGNLLQNSSAKATSSVSEGNLRIDVFFDPPEAEDPYTLKIQWQDNRVLKNNVLDRIRLGFSQGSLGCNRDELNKHLSRGRNGLSIAEQHIGYGTTFTILVPVWFQSSKDIIHLFFKLAETMNAIDYIVWAEHGESPDLLGKLLISLNSPNVRAADLASILEDAERFISENNIVSRYWFSGDAKRWFKYVSKSIDNTSFYSLNRSAIDEAKEVIQRVIHKPALSLVQDVTSLLDSSKGHSSFRCSIEGDDLLGNHRFPRISTFFLARYALFWGLNEILYPRQTDSKPIPLKFLFVDAVEDLVRLSILGPAIRPQRNIALPLLTRLKTLGIESSFSVKPKETLTLSIPVWTP